MDGETGGGEVSAWDDFAPDYDLETQALSVLLDDAVARAEAAEAKRDMLAGWLKALVKYESLWADDYSNRCLYCKAAVSASEVLLKPNIERHAADCPWRIAAEYIESANEETLR
jgi:hypothetical protein